jgi:hypothetical protein
VVGVATGIRALIFRTVEAHNRDENKFGDDTRNYSKDSDGNIEITTDTTRDLNSFAPFHLYSEYIGYGIS